MTKEKLKKVTLNRAIKAFDYAVCNVNCKGNAKKSHECIEKKAECQTRKNFIKKLEA